MTDPYFVLPSDEAKLCLQAARAMIQYFSQPTKVYEDFSLWLLSHLGVIAESAKHSMNTEKLWISYHELMASKLFVTKWEAFFFDCSGKVPPLLYQHITDELFEDINKKSFGTSAKLPASESPANVEALSNEEENAIHYVGGYVLRELKKDHSISLILPLIEKLTITEHRYGEYTIYDQRRGQQELIQASNG